jgi:predicted component of type VI protein secretion system
MQVKLVVVNGKAKNREVPLPPTIFVIGRGPKCHLRPHCALVSKLHCAIAQWAGKVVVRDLKSANGTFVNNKRIKGEERVANGDTLRVGTLEFTIQIKIETNPPMPLPVIHEGDVKWLIESPSDSFTLNPNETLVKDLPPDFLEPSGACTETNHAAVSAGQFLRDYLRQFEQ